jgi:hypothetical protein
VDRDAIPAGASVAAVGRVIDRGGVPVSGHLVRVQARSPEVRWRVELAPRGGRVRR